MTDKTLQDRLRDPAHGFDRNDSLTEDRYVCLCEHLANEAADALDANYRLIAELSMACNAQEARIRELESVLRPIIEWHDKPVDPDRRFSDCAKELDKLIDRAREVL